ncbi:MAG TPA: hypothetical protein VFV99_03385 [Kofleriaceae bacterium]|nr:hypothetical protein [Kofleriaceae bacterium]
MRLFLVFMLVFSSVTALAQPAPMQDKAAERREKIKQRIFALRAYTLTSELQLDEATAGRLFPLLSKFDGEFEKLLVARVDITRRLRTVDTIKDPKAVNKLIDEAAANQRALWDIEEKRLVELRKILTPQQTARLLVVLPALERKIQNQLRKAVQRPKLRRQQAPVDPFATDNDDDDDPFDDAPPAKQRPATKAPRAGKAACNPFDSLQGCAK